MKPKTLRYLASAAIVALAFEVLPRASEAAEDCMADVTINLCSVNRDPWAAEPRNLHTPLQDYETGTGRILDEYVVSGGMVASTSTGPSHRMTLAGESVARWSDE